MDLHLYDSKSAALVPFEPLQEGKATIYLCGPTVQGSPHIGHLRAAASFDILVRWLQRNGLDVTYVRNVTDIDDKILAKGEATGEPWWAVAQKYEREFQAAYAALGLIPPTIEPRATGHITDQIELVQRLIDRGHAYEDGEGSVYFDVSSQPDYGSLTHQNPDDLIDGDEGEGTPGKRDPRDFALWKARKETEPETASWSSPWGRGRPAWHLECSAMSQRYLGDAFDIHGGGIDLRFPHHENEQAQSHGAGWDFANLWVHNAWVTTQGEKMSKSVGNTLALDSLLQQAPAPVIRFALSSVHHRSAIEWGPRTLELAQANWDKLSGFVSDATAVAGAPESVLLPAGELPSSFVAAMNDDLNVSAALAVIHEHVKLGRRALAKLEAGEGDAEAVAQELLLVRSMMDVLGVDPGADAWAAPSDLPVADAGTATGELGRALVELAVGLRQLRRQARDWAKSDEVRDRLSALGVTVEDRPGGAAWTVDPWTGGQQPGDRVAPLRDLLQSLAGELAPSQDGPVLLDAENGEEATRSGEK